MSHSTYRDLETHSKIAGMSICLNMIVKDESHIIENTLGHLCEHFKFDYWVIDDTGSTDGTQDLIRNFFAARKIPGELHETPWKDFGHNRTEAFKHAYNKTDYVLVWDADDSIVGDFKLPKSLTADHYLFIFGDGGSFRYSRTLLFNNRKRWKYVGVLHEYPACCEPAGEAVHVSGNYYFVSGRTGARSKDPNKYLRDAEVLERGLQEEPENDRYAFYCANSYKDAGCPEKAIEFYKKVLTMRGWAEEKYLAAMTIFDLSSSEENLYYLVEANKHSPTRAEAIMRLMRHYCVKDMSRVALMYYTLIQDYFENKYLTDDVSRRLFATQIDYDFYLPYYVVIASANEGKPQIGLKACDIIFHKKPLQITEWWINNLFHNMGLLISDLTPDLGFLFRMLEYRDALGFHLGDRQNKVIADIIDKHRPLLTAPSTRALTPSNGENPKVFFSITSCKRLDLFEKTMNSIMHTWKDLDKIDYFLCVDDNSNPHDRTRMQSLYPYMKFYMKTPAEKGHRQSMNIIWEHLNRLRPMFWIHMEDDFLFFREEYYVMRSVVHLTRHRNANIHQILFNRNYAELYDWSTNGGLQIERGLLVHVQSDSIPGRNCGYWPHYSFRPSVVRVEPILALGNYDSPNAFFEMDYARRWTAAGYKSAFYDTVMCLHIGKLTSDKTGANAYTLNGESQFGGSIPTLVVEELMGDPTASKTLVVNLVRRADRRATMEETLRRMDMSGCEFFEAVDGQALTVTNEIITLFAGNDFNSRRGYIGCALSHYRIWQRLVADASCGYYVIFEDDISLCENFTERLQEAKSYFVDNHVDIMMLGYTEADREARFQAGVSPFAPLNRAKYLGGTFGYIISQRAARAYLDYIRDNGIRHGIDYLLKLLPDSLSFVSVHPHIVHTEWADSISSGVDSDIQYDGERLNLFEEWEFHPRLDHIGDDIVYDGRKSHDLLLRKAIQTPGCVAFNTLGFMKHAAQIPLESSPWFGDGDGIYVKRGAGTPRRKRVKLLCGWESSDTLVQDFKKYTQAHNNQWGTVEFTASDERIDYYVILNSPRPGAKFIPEKTIVLQLEPWCHSASQTWGVKTWGKWAEPDPAKFLRVLGVKSHWTPAFWQLDTPWADLARNYEGKKRDAISCILSGKVHDPGHQHRLRILQYLDAISDISMNVFGRQNYHELTSYVGPVTGAKQDYIRPFKYYFMMENNSEEFYVTEKLWEPILCESLCFYWGSPRIAEHVDPRAYVVLDVSDYAAAAVQIVAAIKANLWEERLPYIREAKARILNELSLAPVIAKIVEGAQ